MTIRNSKAPKFYRVDFALETVSKSDLFKVYNHARKAANAGLKGMEPNRTNRALGYLQRPQVLISKWERYETTQRSCGCWDFRKGHTCKHIIALWMATRIAEQA